MHLVQTLDRYIKRILITQKHSLAYAEMRLIFARVLFEFNIDLAPELGGKDWTNGQRMYNIWEKSPLWMRLS